MKRWWRGGVWIIIWLGFFIAGIFRLDPDFGWHWREGKIISEQGIKKTDQLTYTMPSYEFVDFHWLSNWLMYQGYERIGMVGLAVIYAVIGLEALVIVKAKGASGWSIAGVMLAATVLFIRAGVRPQVESWLLFAIVLAWVRDRELWEKTRGWFPVLVMIWANLHGGFFLAWGVVGVEIVVNAVKARTCKVKEIWMDIVVLGLGVVATLINPFGIKLWLAVIKLVTDPLTRANINEWQPFYWRMELGMFFLGILIVAFGRKRLFESGLKEVIVVIGLFLAALASIRNAPFFALAAAPLASRVVESFFNQINLMGTESKRRAKYFASLLVIVISVVFIQVWTWSVILDMTGNQSEDIFYPRNAVVYFMRLNYPGNVFTSYEWAGYMEWKWEEKKQFIDGRMPEWKNKYPPESESKGSFADYLKITQEVKFGDLFEKYNVKIAIIPANDSQPSKHNKLTSWMQKLLGYKQPEQKYLYKELEKNGWKRVYEDKVAWGYIKNI